MKRKNVNGGTYERLCLVTLTSCYTTRYVVSREYRPETVATELVVTKVARKRVHPLKKKKKRKKGRKEKEEKKKESEKWKANCYFSLCIFVPVCVYVSQSP